MAHVVEYKEFIRVVQRVEALEEENNFLKQLLTVNAWVDREQAAKILVISTKTLRRLTVKGLLTYKCEGRKVLYEVESIRNYLKGIKISARSANERVLESIV